MKFVVEHRKEDINWFLQWRTNCKPYLTILEKTQERLLKGQYHTIFNNTLKIEKALFGW